MDKKSKKSKGKKDAVVQTADGRAAEVAALRRRFLRDVAGILRRSHQDDERLRRDGFPPLGDGPYGPGLW